MTALAGVKGDGNAFDPSGVEGEVLRRYGRAAEAVEPALCCPQPPADADLGDFLPREIVEKDYGCGDPTRYVSLGERVLDVGSGSGKACYLLGRKVGSEGSVIGADFNDAMLALARRHQRAMAEKLGYDNVRFVKARIQDLALDLERVERWLAARPVTDLSRWAELEAECERLRRDTPAVADASVDVVVSNCVLNLVRPADKRRLFAEIHRVLRPGGRAVISDIVCDETPTPRIVNDPQLWSGCISGAFREDELLERFVEAGLYGVEILSRQETPWQVIDGVEFRSMTVRAFKGTEGRCLERNQAVIYRGPWSSVRDDDGHTLHRGRRMAVCDKTYRILTNADGPYARQVVGVSPYVEVPLESAAVFDCRGAAMRDPRQTKGRDYRETRTGDGDSCCSDDGCCA